MSQAYKKELDTQNQFKSTAKRALKDDGLTEEVIDRVLSSPSRKTFTKKVVRLEERDNRGLNQMPKSLIKQGYIVLNSSYTQAANPSSMRDFGPARNVVYNFPAQSDRNTDADSILGSDTYSVYSTPQKMKSSKLNTFSSPKKSS